MDAFDRLSQLSSTLKERASSIRKSAVRHFERGLHWLGQWLKRRRRPVLVVIVGGLLLYLGLRWYGPQVWSAYISKPEIFTPFFTPIAALLAGLAAFGQWRTARLRHEEQTNADRRRRIIESYSKAVTQLASDKLEERLGGIYTLESISKESLDDYWTVMETLTAFVRERSQRNERERTAIGLEERISKRAYFLWEKNNRPQGGDFRRQAEVLEKLGEPPATDIAAVLSVIKRRSDVSQKRERVNGWHLDLSGAVLKQAYLAGAHLEGANLVVAHLERAGLDDAHLEEASLYGAHLEEAILGGAHLEGASLGAAHLEEANLVVAHLEGAFLSGAHLEGAVLSGAHLEGATFAAAEGLIADATGLSEEQLAEAHGDAATRLPAGLTRPAHWAGAGCGRATKIVSALSR